MTTTTETSLLLELYTTMVTAREMDHIEEEYTGRGEAFFHVSGAGHEGTAALAPHLIKEDWLHCHYRDKALMLARGITPRMFFLSLFTKAESHSRGRQMNAHMSSPEHNILSLVGPVGNSALQAVGVASVIKAHESRPIVLCSLGDGMTQQGEVLEAIGHAVRDELPVLFLIQDNAFAISTKTKGRTFYSTPDAAVDQFYTRPLVHVDGRNPLAAGEVLGAEVAAIRKDRKSRFVVFDVDRLSNHTNADDQRMYRTADEIEAARRSGDPLVPLRRELERSGVSAEALDRLHEETISELRREAAEAQRSAEPEPTHLASPPLPQRLSDPELEYRGSDSEERLTMLEAIREVLRNRMAKDERVTLFGEDLEDPKGDVFGITRGLTDSFPGRVVNSPLAEATIVGVSIGQALAGKRPVAFLQFADFLPIAFNQIFAELGSMYWRTDGGWQVPVIVMITCGGYRPGLGPFHASTLEAIAAHTPGVDVFMPSAAADAAGLLNAAFESERPTLFFYPKNCLNDRSSTTGTDVSKQLVPIGRARTVRSGDAITLVGWGNTVRLCMQTAEALAEAGAEAEVIDLRSIVPWEIDAVVASAQRTGRMIVTHEDSHTAGMGAEVLSTVAERTSRSIAMRRVTRGDTYVPCNFGNQLEVLPSYKRILETAVELLGGSVAWKIAASEAAGTHTIEAIGSSPSDESITVVEWQIVAGDELSAGQPIAELEADKAAFSFKSPSAGVVEELLVPEGDTVSVGTPIVRVRSAEQEAVIKPITRENPGTPVITGIAAGSASDRAAASRSEGPSRESTPAAGTQSGVAVIASITSAIGGRTVGNDEIAANCPAWTPEDIVKRTGIRTRPWAVEDQTALSLAVDATKKALEQSRVTIEEIDMIICATGTPTRTTPSMAAMIHYELSGDEPRSLAAFDINAACSGYVYGAKLAADHLARFPGQRVLLVTTELLSRKLDVADADTAPIFGDAATASLIVSADHAGEVSTLGMSSGKRPIGLAITSTSLGALGESGEALSVPIEPADYIAMDGPRVFQQAVRSMVDALEQACRIAGIGVEELSMVVPHQANQRIITAVRRRIKAPSERVFSNIEHRGNTSSSTIPLALEELAASLDRGARLGLTAFGGGYTFGGAVLTVI